MIYTLVFFLSLVWGWRMVMFQRSGFYVGASVSEQHASERDSSTSGQLSAIQA